MKPIPKRIHDPIKQARKKLIISLSLFSSLLIFGTLGYYFIDRIDQVEGQRTLIDSFYFTLVVLTTVGMEGPLSSMERNFSIVVMLVGIFLAAAAASNLVAFAIDGELNKHFGRRKLLKQIKSLKNHFIIVGYGRMGKALCDQMLGMDMPFVLVELDEDKVAEAETHGILYIQGDATDEEVLLSAGLENASGLATCLPHDPANVFVTLSARQLKPEMDIVARSEDPATESKLLKAGATRTICPAKAGAHQLYEMLAKPAVVDLIRSTSSEANNLDVCAFLVEKFPNLIGKTIAESQIRENTGMAVTALEREGVHHFVPPSNMKLKATDKLFLMGPDSSTDKLISFYSQT